MKSDADLIRAALIRANLAGLSVGEKAEARAALDRIEAELADLRIENQQLREAYGE